MDKRAKAVAYRTVFNTLEGKLVLADILNDCGFFFLGDLNSASDIARLNVGRRILGKMGIWDAPSVKPLIEKFLEIPIPKEKKDE